MKSNVMKQPHAKELKNSQEIKFKNLTKIIETIDHGRQTIR